MEYKNPSQTSELNMMADMAERVANELRRVDADNASPDDVELALRGITRNAENILTRMRLAYEQALCAKVAQKVRAAEATK